MESPLDSLIVNYQPEERPTGPVSLEDGMYGRRAVLHSSWSDELLGYLESNNVVELELNIGKGWRGHDLSFLAKLPNLMAFEIFNFGIPSIEPIHHLHKLRKLGVTTYCKTAIDFSAFPELESCGLEWRAKAKSLFACTTLKKLFINCYRGKDTASFAKLVNLESLSILNAPIQNLHGLSDLLQLRYLRLANLRKLASLEGIERLVNLEELEIQSCKAIRSIKEVSSFLRLRKLIFSYCGDIETLKPLEKLRDLEMVVFIESTNIVDGDLSPLSQLPKLARVVFQNRRNYLYRCDGYGNLHKR